MKPRLVAALSVLVLLGAGESARAWVCCTADFSPGRLQAGGVKGAAPWRYNPAGAPAVFAGAAPPAALTNAFTTWNDDPGSALAFAQGANTANACGANNDGVNTIGWAALGAGTNASTLIRMGAAVGGVSTIAEFDMCFSSNVTWVAGASPSVDLESTALHELGHALGLNHPDGNLPPIVAGNGQRASGQYARVLMAAFQSPHAIPVIRRTLLCDDKAGAAFIYPPLDPPVGEFRDYASQQTGGCDFGDAPDPFTGIARYPSREGGEDANRNGVSDLGDSVYRDVDASFRVSAGDVRLSTVGLLPPGAVVAGNADIGTNLFGFMANERHADTGATAGAYDVGEAIYRDNDASGTVTAGDTRLIPPAGLGSGSTVSAGNADVGVALVAFAANERHDQRISDGPIQFDEGEDLDGNGALGAGNGARHKDSRMEWLGPIAAAAGTRLPKEDVMRATFAPKNAVLPAPPAVAPWPSGVVAGQKSPSAAAAAVPASATFEPQTLQVNLDELDDGVSLRGPLFPGVPVLMDVLVSTNGKAAGRYAPADPTKRINLNGWEDWNGDGDWEDWGPPTAGGVVFVGGGAPPCTPPAPSDEYVLTWSGSPAADQFASVNFCGGTAFGANARILTFWITPPAATTGQPFYGRFRVDYGENVGQNLRDFSDLTLVPSRNAALDASSAADRALQIGFEQGEALYGEVEDYLQKVQIEIDEFPNTTAQVTMSSPLGVETLDLAGPTRVEVDLGGLHDGDGNLREEVATRMAQLELSGSSGLLGPLTVSLRPPSQHPFQLSTGKIEETTNATPAVLDVPPFAAAGTAESTFDVYFSIEAPSAPSTYQHLHNDVPCHMRAVISHKPPARGERYTCQNTPIALLDQNDAPTGVTLTNEFHTPVPEVEIDSFPNSLAQVDLRFPPGSSTPHLVDLTGPSTVVVDIEHPADTDGDGLEQVKTEMIELELTGHDPTLGDIAVHRRSPSLDPYQRTTGEIEESSNATPATLDLPPFVNTPSTLSASSFFNVYFEVTLADQGMVLHNHAPKVMRGTIYHKPPGEGDTYVSPEFIPLFDNSEQLVAEIGPGYHTPNPKPNRPEIDIFSATTAQADIRIPPNSQTPHIVQLTGPSAVAVDLPGLADTDNDTKEQVTTEMILLDLVGQSPLYGPIHARLRPTARDPFLRTVGEIEENFNFTQGVLDVPPFVTSPSGLTAQSVFNVLVEVELPNQGLTLHNHVPKDMSGTIRHKPPAPGDTYQNPLFIDLFDAQETLVAKWGPGFHVPNPSVGPPVVPQNSLLVTKLGPTGSNLALNWNASLCSAAGYEILYGSRSGFPPGPSGAYQLLGGDCHRGNPPITWNTPPTTGLLWFLVVANDGAQIEGSWGTNGLHVERQGQGPGGSSGVCAQSKDLSNTCGQGAAAVAP